MNLRDYFAGQALSGVMSIPEACDNWGESEISFLVWAQADQMLTDRLEEPERLPTRCEIAVSAMQGLLAGGVRHDFEPEYVAEIAVKCAEALLAKLSKPDMVGGAT